MKTMLRISALSIVLLSPLFGTAQDDWNWGDQVDKAKEKNVLYTDALKAKNYEAAIEPLSWLLENTPDLNPSIYINGVKIYEALGKKETDPVKKDEYVQFGLGLFDKRSEIYSSDKNEIIERKGIFAYTFYRKTKEQYERVFNILSEAFELNGAEMNRGALVALMDMTYKNYLYKRLTDEQVIDLYSNISEALNKQKEVANASDKKKLTKYLDNVDRLLAATKIEISCDLVEERFGPKLDEGNDVNIAKRIFDLMIKGKCIDRPLALRAAEVIQTNDPTYGVAKFLGAKNQQEGNEEKAMAFFEEAASLTDDNTEKAEMYVSMARIHMKNGQKSTARSTARRALSFDPSHSAAYELIGDLYFTSYGKGPCYGQTSQVEDRAVFIAAYDQYRRAGATSKMSSAKAQFPGIEDIFNEGKTEGQSITIGCWINTTVSLERRPAN